MAPAVRKTVSNSGGVRSSTSSRWAWRHAALAAVDVAWGASIAIAAPSLRRSGDRRDERYLVSAVHFCEPHLDLLVAGGGHVLADVVGPDGELAVPTVDQHDKLDGLRAAQVHEGIERRADAPTGVEDVVHEDDALADDRGGPLGGMERRRLAAHGQATGPGVAIEADV